MSARTWNTWYGVDLDPQGAVVVRGRGRGGSFRADVIAQGAADDPNVAAALAEAGAAAAQGRAGVALAMAGRDGLTRRLTAPMKSPSKARKIFPSLLDTLIPMPLESCATAITAVRPIKDGRVEALAVAVLQSALEARLTEVRPFGLDPAVLDFEPLALWAGALAECPPQAGELCVVAYAGSQRLVCAAGRGQDFDLTLATTVDDTAASMDEAAAKVRHFVRAWGGDASNVVWLWAGPATRNHSWIKAFERALAAESGARGAFVFKTVPEPASFLARSLARRRGEEGPCAVNLRTGFAVAPSMVARGLGRERAAWTTALVAGAALVAVSLGGLAWMRQTDEAARKALFNATRELVGDASIIQPGQELRAAERTVEAREAEMRNLSSLFDSVPANSLKQVIETASRNQLQIDRLSVSDTVLAVAGSAPDWDVTEQLATVQWDGGWTVELKREDAGRDERVIFQIGGTRR